MLTIKQQNKSKNFPRPFGPQSGQATSKMTKAKDRVLAFPYKQFNVAAPIEITHVKDSRHLLKYHGLKSSGVYVWVTPKGAIYVGRSINLYTRVRSYFYRTPKQKGVSLIRRYLNKYGFDTVDLILFILQPSAEFNTLVKMEQAFLDYLKPELNLDKIPTPSRYNAPMSDPTYRVFRQNRSHTISVTNTSGQLLCMFESKTDCVNWMRIHHSTLNRLLNTDQKYLNSFLFRSYVFNQQPQMNFTVFLDHVENKRLMFTSPFASQRQRQRIKNEIKKRKLCAFSIYMIILKKFFRVREIVQFSLKQIGQPFENILITINYLEMYGS